MGLFGEILLFNLHTSIDDLGRACDYSGFRDFAFIIKRRIIRVWVTPTYGRGGITSNGENYNAHALIVGAIGFQQGASDRAIDGICMVPIEFSRARLGDASYFLIIIWMFPLF